MQHHRARKSRRKEFSLKTPNSFALQFKPPEQATLHPVLQLQRAVGNQAVQRMINADQAGLEAQQASPNVKPTSTLPSSVHNVLRSPGQPLAPATRAFMEAGFGQDLSHVRIHTDSKAAESAHHINALAYTAGNDIVFGKGQYAPGTSEGKRLIAHELTHVAQQGMQTIQFDHPMEISKPGDSSEHEAKKASESVM